PNRVQQQARGDDDGEDDRERGREDATSPPHVEGRQRDRAPARGVGLPPVLGDEQAGDQVPLDDEEDVDPDEAAPKAVHVEVVETDEQQGDGTEPPDAATEAGPEPPPTRSTVDTSTTSRAASCGRSSRGSVRAQARVPARTSRWGRR